MICWGKKIAKRNFLATVLVSIQTFITLILMCTRFNLSIFIKMTHRSKIQNSIKHLLDLNSPSLSKWPTRVKLEKLKKTFTRFNLSILHQNGPLEYNSKFQKTLTGSNLSIFIKMACRCEVGVPGQWLIDRVEGGDGDGHLSGLEVQQTGLVQNITQVLRQERGQTRQLELCPPNI